VASSNGYSPLILKGIDDKIDTLSLQMREENLRIFNRLEAALGLLKTIKVLILLQILLTIVQLILLAVSIFFMSHGSAGSGANAAASVANGVAVVKTS